MANVESLFNSLREQLTCSLCLETFKNPKTVPCLHSFCCGCLNELAERRLCSQPIKCPLCRAVIDMPQGKDTFDNFPSSFYLNRLLEVTGLHFDCNKNLQQTCGSCEQTKTVESFCFECECFVCKDCIDLHRKIKSMKSHRIADKSQLKANDVREMIQQKSVFCKKRFHENEPLKYYCRDCKISICDKCAILGHKRHVLELIQEVTEEYKLQMQNSKEQLREKIRNFEDQITRMENAHRALEKRLSSARLGFKTHVESLIKIIRQHERRMEQEIYNIHKEQHELYTANKKCLEIRVVQMKSAEEFADQLLKRNINSEILHTEISVSKRFKDLLKEEEEINPIKRVNVDYVTDGEFSHVLEKTDFGRLIKSHTDPTCCSVEWQDSRDPCALERNQLMVTTYDSDGILSCCDTDHMTAKILSFRGDNVITDVDDRKDGKYVISFTPFHPGSYQVEITVRQELIADCPMTIFVNPRATRSASTLGPSLLDLRPRSRDYRAVMSFGGNGKPGGMFRRPAGIAMSRFGEIAIADSGNHRIQLFTGKGEYVGQFGTEGMAEGQLQGPLGVAYDNADNILVSDSDNHRVQIFTKDGQFIRIVGEEDLEYPWGLCITARGDIAVCDWGDRKIKVFSHHGKLMTRFNSVTKGKSGNPSKPYFIIHHKDKYFVSMDSNCVQVFTSKGEYMYTIGERGHKTRQFKDPRGLTVDQEEHLFLCDSGNHRVQVFTEDGRFVTFGRHGREEGEFDRPQDTVASRDGHIYVTDYFNNSVQVFEVTRPQCHAMSLPVMLPALSESTLTSVHTVQ